MMSSMDIYEIRRRALERLLSEENGTIVQLARRTGTSANYLSQVLSEKIARHMGAQVARRIEDRLELPEGWMDRMSDPQPNISPEAMSVAQNFDKLPANIQAKVAREVAALARYTADDE